MSIIRPASSVLLTRERDGGREIYLVQRAPQLRFMGGFWAFPGGTVMAEDQLTDAAPQDGFVRCAMRELFEETGILPDAIGSGLDAGTRHRIRRELLDESSLAGWQQLVDGAHADDEFLTICTITTPPFAPVRYQTCFLHMRMPEGAEPVIVPGELVAGAFYKPEHALAAWTRGEINIAPPNLFLLGLLAENDWPGFMRQAAAATRQIDAGALHPVYFSPGIFVAPQRTPTLPPATSTNTFIVGNEKLFVVEPATPDRDEQEKLFAKMDQLIHSGKRFEAILLTHHHADHVGAVTAVSQRYRLPVRAHRMTYARIPPGFLAGPALEDGDEIDLGTAPDGSSGWHLRVIHTPGHACDHLCYLDSRYHAALVGDMVSTLSTIVIDPPEGHMRTYLDSLERLLQFPLKTLYPAHGPVHHDGAAVIRRYLTHRKERENAIIDALDTEVNAKSVADLVPAIYTDVETAMHAIAARSLLAGLIKLEEDGICKQGLHGWHLAG